MNQKFAELLTVTLGLGEKELQAACAVNCSDPQLQDEIENGDRTNPGSDGSQIHRDIDDYIVRTVCIQSSG